jgi:hypothetical protein
MHASLSVKCSTLTETGACHQISCNSQISNFMKMRSATLELLCGQTDMSKLTRIFFATCFKRARKGPKSKRLLKQLEVGSSKAVSTVPGSNLSELEIPAPPRNAHIFFLTLLWKLLYYKILRRHCMPVTSCLVIHKSEGTRALH